jgi:hypothetical protein
MKLQFGIKQLVFGAIAGLLGGLAMELYWRLATTLIGKDPRSAEKTQPTPEALRSLDSISLMGKQYQAGESSQAAVGRLLYQTLTGKAPSSETRSLLETLIILGFSVGMSAAYSAIRDPGDNPDIVGGALLGTGAWLGGDELAMPLAGFAEGPTSYPLSLHLHSWAAHVAYGIVAALVAQALEQITSA